MTLVDLMLKLHMDAFYWEKHGIHNTSNEDFCLLLDPLDHTKFVRF